MNRYTTSEELAKMLRRHRECEGRTIPESAKANSISPETMSRWERGYGLLPIVRFLNLMYSRGYVLKFKRVSK